MSRPPPQAPTNASSSSSSSSSNSQNYMGPRHHPYSHPEMHHMGPGFDPTLVGIFPPHAAYEPMFHPPSSSSQAQSSSNFHPPARKPSLISGYHNPFSSPERNERLISSAIQMNQQQQQQQSKFASPQGAHSSSASSMRASNPAMAEAAAAAMVAALGDQMAGRSGFDSTSAAAAAAIAAANTFMSMSMLGAGRPPVNVSPSGGRPEEKYMRGPGVKTRPMSPELHRAPPPPPPKFTPDDPHKDMHSMRERPKMRDISPVEDKYIPRGGSQQPGYPGQFTPAMMAAMSNVMSSSGVPMPPPTSSPSQFVQFIHQQLQQQQSGKPPPDIMINMPPPMSMPVQMSMPVPKKEPTQLMPMFTSKPPAQPPSQPAPVTTSSSSSYVPQVEAISPTPEDQKENSSVQLMKDKIIGEIEKVEKDLASTQYQIEMLKKRTVELEEEQSKKPADGNEDVEKLIQVSKTMTLAEKIYQENRKKAEESHRKYLRPIDENSMDESIPFYQEFADTKQSQEIRFVFDSVMKKRLIKFFKRQIAAKRQREKSLIDNYEELHTKWQKKVDRFENSIKKRQKDGKSREFYEKVFPELRKQREERERLIQKQKAAAGSPSDTPTDMFPPPNPNEPEPNPIEEERKRIYQLAVVPPLCIDARQRRYKFINNNGYVQDPVALFKSIKNEVFWNEKEKEIFLEKLVTFGKNFELIAKFLDKKSVQDCIEYYYLTKKKVNYKMLIRKNQRRRKKEIKTNPNSTQGSQPSSTSGSSQLINSTTSTQISNSCEKKNS